MIDRYDQVGDEECCGRYLEKDSQGEYVLYNDMVELLATLGYNIEDLS